MTEAPSEPPLSARNESDVNNTAEKIMTVIASSSSEKLSKIGDSSKHAPLPQSENCGDGNDHSSEVNDDIPPESPSAPSEKATNALEMSDCLNGSKENILSSVASTEKPLNGATEEYDILNNERAKHSSASDLSKKIEGEVTQNCGDAKDKICDKTKNKIPSQASVVSPKKSVFVASLKTTPSTKVDKTMNGDVEEKDQLANKPSILSPQQRFEENSYPWKSTMPTNEDKKTKPDDIKTCDQKSNRRKSTGGGSFAINDSNIKQEVFGSAKLKVSPRNAQNNYKRKRNSKIVDLSLSKDEDSQEASSKFPSSTKKRIFSSESEHRTTRSQTANRVLSTMDNNKPKKRKSNERINNAPTSVFRPSTYTTQSTSHPSSFSPENDSAGSKSQSPRIDAINPASIKSESKINGEIIIRNCHKDMPDINLIAHNRNDKSSLTVQETYIKENSKITDLKLTKESKSEDDIIKDVESKKSKINEDKSNNTKNTDIKINEEKKESNESMKTNEEKSEEINKHIETNEERSNHIESINAKTNVKVVKAYERDINNIHTKDIDADKAVANQDESTKSKQRETNSNCVLTKVSKLNHVKSENAKAMPQCTSVVKKMVLATSTEHGIEKEDDEDDDDAEMDISQLNDLDQVKTELYLNAVKEHRGKGAERLFSQYWHILGRYLSYPKSIQGSKSAGHRSNRVEKFLKYFLKSRSLKRLHNELILVITKQTMLSHVSKEQFERHVPAPWKRKIRKRGNILVSTTSTSEFKSTCQTEDDRKIKPKSINDIVHVKHEEDKFNVQRFKREFGVASRVWTVYGDESRSIPGAQELQSLESNLMSQNESETNIFETDFHSARLPGALAVDPVVRRIAHNEGMSVSENAVWFVVIALREYVSAVLQQALTNAVGGVQNDSELGQNRSDDVTRLKNTNAEKHMNASSGKVETLEDKTNDTKRKYIITPLDLAQAMASNPLLGGGSRNSCSSRLAWERCISSARDNMHSTSSIELLKLQKRISNEIDVESIKRRKMEVEAIETKEREARLKKEMEEREERLKREKAEREERIKRGKAERDARLKREKVERDEKARREKAEKEERERIMREERSKREKAERTKSLTTTFSVDRARSVPLTNTASNTGQSQTGTRRRRSSSSQSAIETKSPQKSGPVKPTLPSIPKAASVERVSKGNGSLPQTTGNRTTNNIASNKSTEQNSDSPTPKPIPRGRGRGVKDLSTLRAASSAGPGPGPVSTPAQTPNERIPKTNASDERPAMARQLQNMSGRGTGVKDLAALRARRLAIESSRNTPASTTEHQNSQEESNAGKTTHQRQNSIGSTGTDMRLPSMNSFVSSQRSQGEAMTVQGDQVMIGDIPKRGMGEKQLMLLRKAEERRRVEEKQDEKLTSNKNKTKKAVGAVS